MIVIQRKVMKLVFGSSLLGAYWNGLSREEIPVSPGFSITCSYELAWFEAEPLEEITY